LACYHFNASIVSRGNGSSIAAAVAYISGEKLHDSYDGKIHDRSHRRDVIYKATLLPLSAPREFLDRQTWLDALNRAERRCDAQMARSIKVALPNELTFEEQVALVEEFVSENFIAQGFLADLAIHRGLLNRHRVSEDIEPVEERRDNPHAHIVVPLRTVDEDGFSRTKTQGRYMNNPSYLNQWRREWARLQNREFERLGLDVRVSHESLAARGINREPTKHIGAAAMALENRGIQTERGDQYRAVIALNRSRELERQLERQRMHDRSRNMERTR